MGEVSEPAVSLELVLAQFAAKEEYCKELEVSQKTLQRQLQELLQGNHASQSVTRKEKQWEIEKSKLISDLEVANHGLAEKEGLVHQLERDIQASRLAVKQLQSKSHEAERWMERESMEKQRVQADLEDARLAIEDLEKNCRLKDEAAAFQRKALNESSQKLDSQKRELEKILEEARRKAQQLAELECEHQIVTESLDQKSKQLLSLKDDYEKLCTSHKGMQSEGLLEREDVLKSLEESEAMLEVQEGKMRKLEKELRKIKSQAKQLETRCAASEADAISKTASLTKAQSELETYALLIAELAEVKEEATLLKGKLAEAEKDLAQESTSRSTAETALQEYKDREEHLLKVEVGHSELQGKAKWRNEQFQSLEEAYTKLRTQFQESQCEWEAEKSQMVKEIDHLRDGLGSKVKLAQYLDTQLDMLRQALDHEHIHQRGLEQELMDARAAMNVAGAEFDKARFAFDIIREETVTKLVLLDQYIAAGEKQITETQLDQCTNGLSGLNASEDGLLLHDDLNVAHQDVGIEKGKVVSVTKIAWEEEKEKVLRIVRDAEASLACKDLRLRELGVEIDGTWSLLNVLEDPNAEPLQLDTEEKKHGIGQINHYGMQSKEVVQIPVDIEQSILSMPSEVSKVETVVGQMAYDQEALAGHDVDIQQPLLRLKEQEAQLLDLQAQCQSLQNILKQRDAHQKRIQGAQERALGQLQAEGKAWQDERENLVSTLDALESQRLDLEQQRNEMQSDMDRLRDVICKLEDRGALLEQQISEQSLLAELATGQLAIERAEGERLKRESQLLTASFEGALAAKDTCLEQLHCRFRELEDSYARSTEILQSKSLHSLSLERRLEAQQELQSNLEKHLHVLGMELEETTGKAERVAMVESSLQEKLRELECKSKDMKQALEIQLEALKAQLALSENQLLEVGQQLGDMSAERGALLEALRVKEAEKDELRKEKKSLLMENAYLEGVTTSLEVKKQELLRETESNKVAIEELCAAREEAESSLASKGGELQDIYTKLGYADTMKLQLQIAEEKTQAMEQTLSDTQVTVEDKEERLAASEWAVQQLASEIAKAKHSLVQKQREEAFLQERLLDLERHLRDKEREMVEMESYLEAVLLSNESKQADIDTLTLKMQDLKKGADEWKLREIDLEMELHNLKATLEEREAALEEAKCEAQSAIGVHQVMEGAIESLKKQLANTGFGNSTQQGEMERLCHDLESAKEAASLGSTQLQGLHERLRQLENSSEDRIRRAKSTSDELQQELLSTQSQLQSCELRLGATQLDLAQYKEKCEGLLAALAKKSKLVEDMEVKLACVEMNLTKQALAVEQAISERTQVMQDLQTQAGIQRALQQSLAAMECQVGDMELQKVKIEQEVRRLKKALDSERKESASKAQAADCYKCQLEQLQEISDQYGDAQLLISRLTDELQMTFSTVEERDCRLSKLQSSLASVQEELHVLHDALAAKECERENLAVKLTVVESQMEKSQIEMSQMQQALESAESRLSSEAMHALLHVAALKKVKAELDEWKEKALSLSAEGSNIKQDLGNSLKEMQAELLGWKGRAEALSAEKVELEAALQFLQCELEGWKERAEVAAQEGRVVREQLGTAIKSLQNDLDGWKEDVASVQEEGVAMNVELESDLQMLQDRLKGEKLIIDETNVNRVELLSTAMRMLHVGLKRWRQEAIHTFRNGQIVREELDNSILDLRSELDDWKGRAATAIDEEGRLRGEFDSSVQELQREVEVWKSMAEAGSSQKADLERSVKDLQLQLAGWKEKAAAAVDEDRRVKMTHEASLVELQEELGVWKEKVAIAAEESNQLQAAYVVSMKHMETEIQTLKQTAKMADDEGKAMKADLDQMRTEVCLAKKAVDFEPLKDRNESPTKLIFSRDAITGLQEHQNNAFAVAEENECLQSQLQQALITIEDLTIRVEHMKARESTVEELTQQLESDLLMAQEEAHTRKQKMLHILVQLEKTHASQQELQAQLKLQHEQLLHEDGLAVAAAFLEKQKDPLVIQTKNVQMQKSQLDCSNELFMDIHSMENESFLTKSKALRSKCDVHQIATDLETALNDLREKELLVSELQSEVSDLRLLLRQLESTRDTTEEILQAAKMPRGREHSKGVDCRNESGEICRENLVAPGPYLTWAGFPSSQPSIPSPKGCPSIRRRNVVAPLQVKSASRVHNDAGSCKILGEADENSFTFGPLSSPSPLSKARKSRENHSNLFLSSLF